MTTAFVRRLTLLVFAIAVLVTVSQAVAAVTNVRNFGAKGDGQSDDTAAIRRAVKAGANGSVHIPSGTFKIFQIIRLPGGTRLYGNGSESKIVQATDNLGIFEILAGASHVEIDHLQLTEHGTVHGNQLGRGAVYINPGGEPNPVSDVHIHHNVFHCASTSCIAANVLIDSKIESNSFDNDGTGEHGIYLSSRGDGYSRNVIIDSNTFHSTYEGRVENGAIELAIQLRATKQITITNNRINGWTDGILTIPEDMNRSRGTHPDVVGLTVIGNTISGTSDDCFVVFGGKLKRALVADNTFDSCGQNGIRSNVPLDDSMFDHNRITRSGEVAIRLNQVSRSLFSNNYIRDAGAAPHEANAEDTADIRLNNQNSGNVFVGNTMAAGLARVGHHELSVGGGLGSSINPHNCFASSSFAANGGQKSAAGLLGADCSDAMQPPVARPRRLFLSSQGVQQIEIANPGRVPMRIIQVIPSSSIQTDARDCVGLRPAGSSCRIAVTLASDAPSQTGQVDIVYANGGPANETIEIPVSR